MPGPLAALKVLEAANFISGPYAAMLLADLGAEVVKVELPGTGDPFRVWGERQGEIRPQFAAYNRGKKSVTINFQSPSGREVYMGLAQDADVVIENFRPGVVDRLGVGYAALGASRPGLVYCAITGMGSSGPYSQRPTYDAIAQAMSGLLSNLTDMRDPCPVGPPMSDQLTGVYAAYGILAALVARGATGRGQKLEVSMLSATMAFLPEAIANYTLDGEVSELYTRPHRSQSYAFIASDGLPLAIHLSSPTKFWQGLCAAVERSELVDDPRFKNKDGRVTHYAELRAELADRFATRPRAEWLRLLEEHDVPAAPINTIAEALSDPQAQHLGMTRTFGQSDRAMQLVGYAANFADTPLEPGLPPPELGEHNAAVFGRLGYTEEDVERMRGEGAI